MSRIPPPKIANKKLWNKLTSNAMFSGDDFGLFVDDAIHTLNKLPNECVNTCLTSPPYWSARDYEHDQQIGLEETVDEYVSHIVSVFDKIQRILTPDGTVWLNLGDCYINGSSTSNSTWQRNKQLALIPFRTVLALQEHGWWVRNNVVWHKPNAMPTSVRDRLTNTWEPLFLLSKAEQYYFDLDAIRIPHKTNDSIERKRAELGHNNGKAKGKGDLRRWLNSPRHRATIDGIKQVRRRPNAPDPTKLAAYLREAMEEKGVNIKWVVEQLGQPFERVRHYIRTDRIGARLPPEETWEQLKELLNLGTEFDDAMAVEIGDNVFRNHPKGRNPGDVQSISLSGNSMGHFATMPAALAKWALRATLPINGICLDPFAGSCTTGRVTLELGGRFIGIDLRREYLESFMQETKKRKRAFIA